MKVVLLAGGVGSRIEEIAERKPKPMIEIGGMPILWHIMKTFSYYGFNEFIVCAGFRQNVIKEWFADYYMNTRDVMFDFTMDNSINILDPSHEPWKVIVANTGEETMTGGRIKRIEKYVKGEKFFMTYGDGVCDVNLKELLEFHNKHGKIATLTAVVQKQDKGIIEIGIDNSVHSFREKVNSNKTFINAGYMVLEPEIFKYLDDDNTVFENGPMEMLVKNNELMSYTHEGFWQCMDNPREKMLLEKLWASNKAPWKVWK